MTGLELTMRGGAQNQPAGRGLVLLLLAFVGITAALCTVFALVVTVIQGWTEHTEAQWPTVTARIERCGLDVYNHRTQSYWIDCRLSYTVRGEDLVSQVHSRSTRAPGRVIWEYPAGQFEGMQEWVDRHPEGTPMVVHYDPANRSKAVLVVTDMPLAGAQTSNNLKLLGFFAALSVVLLTIARIARPRSAPYA
jgi:hypothetical protein